MDNHPIPQDVTGFQFKLIGNMTIKQFAYLATGVILAWIFLQLPITVFVKFPISLVFALLGISLAYLPIGGRPMDLMIGNFIKAYFRPTQFVYEKTGRQLYFPHKTSAQILPNRHVPPIVSSPQTKTISFTPTPISAPKPQFINQPVIQKVAEPPAPKPPMANPPAPAPAVKEEIKIINPPPRSFGRNASLFRAPEFPNLITGFVRDSRGNPLSNILIEIKDKDNNPVRAFKTNEVGRFASATPLTNGAYTISLEDPKGLNKFEPKTINITGEIISPIELQSVDMREELRKSLFNSSNGQNG